MGTHPNVSYDKFPKQGRHFHKRCQVCFNYDTSKYVTGTIVRDDIEEPGLTIIHLDNGNLILATECQYHPL